MGSPEPRSFSRGKRGIAGSLVFTVFDRDALIAALQSHIEKEKTFHRIGNNTLEYERISVDEWDIKMKEIALNGVANASDNAEQVTKNIASAATPVYEDEIPPFD